MMEKLCSQSRCDSSAGTDPLQQVCGVVERVDVISRELEVQLPAKSVLVDVPIDCPIVLHGERIKLRMVQNGDQVAITFLKKSDTLRARYLDVQPTM